MIKIILAFLFVFSVFFFGIKVVREMTGMEQWRLTKYFTYSILCAMLTTVLLTLIVIFF
jgi:hypothetical protein